MKLFGGKKAGKNELVTENTSVELEEAVEAQEKVPAEAPVIDIVPAIEEPVQEAVEEAVVSQDESVVTSIAETFGIPEEELQADPAEVAAAVTDAFAAAQAAVAAEKEGKKKLTRAEKKAAKAEAKEAAKSEKAAAKDAAKAEKKAAKKAKKEAKKWSLGKKLLFTVVLVFALAVTGCAGYFVREMWVTDEVLDIYEADFAGEIIMSNSNYDDATNPLDNTDENSEATPVDSTRKKGVYTFLVAARDVASGCTDVIITGTFDTVNGTINMVSIPRDTMINKGNLKINTAYQGDLSSGGNGVDGLLKEMKKILGYDIDSYAIVDVEAAEKLIDAIGGVYFDVPMDMDYMDPDQGLYINLKAGYQKLSGADAVAMLRYRKGYANQDLGRISTQHDFILALADQMLDVGNIPNLGTAIEIYKEHVQSNLTAGNILFYVKNFLSMDVDNIQFVDMPQMMGGFVNNQSFIFINPQKWITVINEYLNPYKDDLKQTNLNIKTSADQGKTFFYTGG